MNSVEGGGKVVELTAPKADCSDVFVMLYVSESITVSHIMGEVFTSWVSCLVPVDEMFSLDKSITVS